METWKRTRWRLLAGAVGRWATQRRRRARLWSAAPVGHLAALTTPVASPTVSQLAGAARAMMYWLPLAHWTVNVMLEIRQPSAVRLNW